MDTANAPPRLELVAHLDAPPGDRSFGEWAWDLHRWGHFTMARAAVTGASMALRLWENYQAPDPDEAAVFQSAQPREALLLIDVSLRSGELSSAGLRSLLPAMRAFAEQLVFYTEEASGNADIVARREAALSAYLAALEALEVATWNEAEALTEVIDAEERRARTQAGPALNVVRALAHTCRATGATADQVRLALRTALVGDDSGLIVDLSVGGVQT